MSQISYPCTESSPTTRIPAAPTLRKRSIRSVSVALVLWATLAMIPSFVLAAGSGTNRLIAFQGNILLAYYAGQYKVIKNSEGLYGYGWLDDHDVFVAYQQGHGEAAADMDVIDVRTGKTKALNPYIGAAGSSNFAVNPDTGLIVYTVPAGVAWMRVDIAANTYKTDDLEDYQPCFAVFWLDDRTVGCMTDDDRSKLMKIPVPATLLSKANKTPIKAAQSEHGTNSQPKANVSSPMRMKELEQENKKLKQMLAEERLKEQILQKALAK